MFGFTKRNGYRGDGAGLAWPHSPSGTGELKDVFGSRPFSYHLLTTGYNYDFHRGVDINTADRDPLYSPVSGSIIRRHYTCFSFENSLQLDEFTLTTPSSSLSVALGTNKLIATCSRVGSVSFPSGIDTYAFKNERSYMEGDDFSLEIQLESAISINGGFGIGIFNASKSQYNALEYNGSTFTIRAVGTTTFTANNTTYAASGKTWFRLSYVAATTTWSWDHSTDGDNWTSLATETGRSFSSVAADMIPMIYWRSADSGTAYTINVIQFNYHSEWDSIGRFGNWYEISDGTQKLVLVHFSTPIANRQHISAGTFLGYSGKSGADIRSGRIIAEHCHLELHRNIKYIYSNTECVNPMDSSYGLPRANVSNNVSHGMTSANDPDGVASWKVSISVSRAAQDFDFNKITLVGNLATRTINWDTREGLNADVDIPKNNGVYIVPSLFDETSLTYDCDFYFNKSVVGSSNPSYTLYDTQNVVLGTG